MMKRYMILLGLHVLLPFVLADLINVFITRLLCMSLNN